MNKQQTIKSAWDDGGWENDLAENDDWTLDEFDKNADKGQGYSSKHKSSSFYEDHQDGTDYQNLDLNKLTDWEISQHKQKMDKVYNKNIIKPNDPHFVYDKRIQFSKPASVEESWE